MDTLNDALRWYLVLVAVTWAVAPLVALLCRRLPDRGAGIARPVALLALVLPTWWLASLDLVPYTTAGLWATVAVLAVASWAVGVRARVIDRQWLGAMLVAEVIAIAAFALYVWFRGHQPAIIQTEKPMDNLFLASSIRTGTIPPPDPWFAGEPINYYYLGYLLNGSVARMAGVAEGIAFNLALAGTFAASVAAAASLGFNVVRRFTSGGRAVAAGILAVAIVVWGGNGYSWTTFLRDPSATLDTWWWGGIGWDSSRVIVDGATETINEFPAFSFVLGDLHPHVMALPFALMALGLALNLLVGLVPSRRVSGPRGGHPGQHVERAAKLVAPTTLGRIAASGALIGSLYALNSWDLPTYGLVAALALLAALWSAPVRDRAIAVAVLGAAALVAWLPFFVAFSPPLGAEVTGIPAWLDDVPIVTTLLTTLAPVTGERTSFGELLAVFGVPVAIAAVFLAWSLFRPSRTGRTGLRATEFLVIVVALVVLTLLAQTPVLLVAGLLVTGAIEVVRREGAATARSVAAGLFAVGFLLVVATELFFIRDVFGTRMNTVFKVHYQAWLLLGVASAVALLVLWSDARRLPPPGRVTLRGGTALAGVVIVLLVSVYPVVAGQRYSEVYEDRGWTSLDGLAYMREELPDEAAAIAWLSDAADPGDRVLEAAACSYTTVERNGRVPANPVSVSTGLPTLMGWVGHEQQWRNGVEPDYGDIQPRATEVAALYADPAAAMASPYGFDYVFVGVSERDGSPSLDGGLCPWSGPYEIDDAAFLAAGWQVAFQQGDVTVYARPGA